MKGYGVGTGGIVLVLLVVDDLANGIDYLRQHMACGHLEGMECAWGMYGLSGLIRFTRLIGLINLINLVNLINLFSYLGNPHSPYYYYTS